MADSSVSGPVPSTSVLKRRTPYEDRELAGLFELFDRLPPGDEKATLSAIARDRLRAQFPRGVDQTGVAQFVSGLNIEVDLGDLFGAEFYVGHCNESAVVSALCRTLPQGAKAIDVGANFGLYALHAARFAGKLARVVAFEPAPQTFGLLEANIKRNRLSARIKARRAAVSDAPGVATFHVATDQSFSGLRDTGRSPLREAVEVVQVSLDSDAAVKALGAVDFLKIDTEGGEAGVLAGARQTIERSPGLVVLMEYSVKNLTADQAANVRMRVDELLARKMRAWTIDLSDAAASLKSAAQLPASFNGSLLFAGPEAHWVDAFLAALARSAPAATPDVELAWSAAQSLLRVVRQGQQDLTVLERWGSRAGLPDGVGLGQRVVEHIERLEACSKSLTARLENAATAAKSDQDRTDQRQESERLKLKQEEVEWYSARLEQQRRETDALRTMAEQKDLEVTALHEKIASLRGFMNKLSDQLQAKSEEVIRLMERREADMAARGEIEVQWTKSSDALRSRIEALVGELSSARSENDALEEKRLALRGHVDALNEKLAQAAATRAAEAAEYERRIAGREEVLDAVQVQRAALQKIIDTQNEKLEQAAAVRAADMARYREQLEEREAALGAAHAKQVELQDIVSGLNENLEQSSQKWAAVSAAYRHKLTQSEEALEVARTEHARLQAAVEDLTSKLVQSSAARALEVADYQQRLAEREESLQVAEKKRLSMRVIIDDLNEKLVEIGSARSAEFVRYQREIADRQEAVELLENQRIAALGVIDELNEKLAQTLFERASEIDNYQRTISKHVEARALLEREQADALGVIDELNEKLAQTVSAREVERRAAETKRIAMRAIIDETNGKLEQAVLSWKAEAATHDASRRHADVRISELKKVAFEHEEVVAALRDALASANARAEELMLEKTAAEQSCQHLQRQMSDTAAALDERRVQIRQLQQELALKKLGRHF